MKEKFEPKKPKKETIPPIPEEPKPFEQGTEIFSDDDSEDNPHGVPIWDPRKHL